MERRRTNDEEIEVEGKDRVVENENEKSQIR